MEFIDILKPALIQALYDFGGWFGITKENASHWFAKPFRVIKLALDYPVSYYVLSSYYKPNIIVSFYYAKQSGLCDAIYLIYWYILKDEKYETEGKKINWFWWTFPLGWIFTVIASLANKKFTKGEMKLRTFWIQLGVQLVISYLISVM